MKNYILSQAQKDTDVRRNFIPCSFCLIGLGEFETRSKILIRDKDGKPKKVIKKTKKGKEEKFIYKYGNWVKKTGEKKIIWDGKKSVLIKFLEEYGNKKNGYRYAIKRETINPVYCCEECYKKYKKKKVK